MISIVQVDTTVVNLAAKPIGTAFAATTGRLQWIIDGYNLVYAALLLAGGLIADLYGRRRAFVVGLLVFAAASLVCAAAPTVPILIGGRALAGIGAALLLPASLAIIRLVWPDPAERGRTLGIWAACNGVALAVGPMLGGLLIDRLGWRSIFAIAIPPALAALGLALRALPESSDPQDRSFDLPAQFLGVLALGGLAVGAIELETAWPTAFVAFGVAAGALAGFIRHETNSGPTALVPMDMLSIPAFRGTVIATGAMTFGMYGVLFLLPLAWQAGGGLGPASAGLALMPMALVFVLASPFSGALAGRFGVASMAAAGVATIGCGLVLLGATAGWASMLPAEAGLGLTGLGMGLATGPLMDAAVGSVPSARSGTAASLINVARMAGATMGVAILGTIYSFAGAGSSGLRAALLLGGFVQLASATTARATISRNAKGR